MMNLLLAPLKLILTPIKWVFTFLLSQIVGKIIGIIVGITILIWLLVQWIGGWSVVQYENLKPSDVAVVFGAGLYADGTPTPYLKERLNVGARLYKEGKVRVVLVSGDNAEHSHNEPQAMADYLAGLGIPREAIVRDFAGFDTYNSCVRAKEVFGVAKAILVTQDYHLRRATFLCGSQGINVQGVAAITSPTDPISWAWYNVREIAASDKSVFEVVTRAKPKLPTVPDNSVTQVIGNTVDTSRTALNEFLNDPQGYLNRLLNQSNQQVNKLLHQK
ncbi:MAG: YdcF family protein [Candidatus Ancillula sp.]|jgi:vancomycin permeability regulator SanA|nr:YdcF family protein [Candidatus Ancillula sp.]